MDNHDKFAKLTEDLKKDLEQEAERRRTVDVLAITGSVFVGYLAEKLLEKKVLTKEEADKMQMDAGLHARKVMEAMGYKFKE